MSFATQKTSPSVAEAEAAASAAEAVAEHPDSPCINVCRIDENTGLCLGCLRRRVEIRLWKKSDGAVKRRILGVVAVRRRLQSTAEQQRFRRESELCLAEKAALKAAAQAKGNA